MDDAMGDVQRDPADLSGMDPASAREYLHAHLTSLKLTQSKAAQADDEAASWDKRAALAAEKGMSELQAAAQREAETARGKAASLRQEAAVLEGQIQRMREQLPGLEATLRSVDPDLLLANLQMTTGEALDDGSAAAARATDGLIKEAKADQDLAALKAKLGMGPAPAAPSSDPAGGGTDDGSAAAR